MIVFGLPRASFAEFSQKNFAVALGAQYSSLLQKRGIITYEGYQVVPIISVQLWNPNLLVAGSSLYYVQPIWGESHQFRFRLNVDSTKDEPLYYTEEDELDRVRRGKTSEFDVFYEWRFEGGSHFRLQYSKDLVEHKGAYAEAYLHLALFDFIGEGKKVLIQPGLFGAIGGGDQKHNEYLYGLGVGEKDQVTNVQYGLSVTSPGFIDHFWPTLKVTRFELVGDEVRGASFVQETEGYQIELLFAFRVF